HVVSLAKMRTGNQECRAYSRDDKSDFPDPLVCRHWHPEEASTLARPPQEVPLGSVRQPSEHRCPSRPSLSTHTTPTPLPPSRALLPPRRAARVRRRPHRGPLARGGGGGPPQKRSAPRGPSGTPRVLK